MTLRERMDCLFLLHHAKRPVLVFLSGVRGGEELERLLGIPKLDCDWLLTVETQEQLSDLLMGVRAVYEHDGSFPNFSEWRKKFTQ